MKTIAKWSVLVMFVLGIAVSLAIAVCPDPVGATVALRNGEWATLSAHFDRAQAERLSAVRPIIAKSGFSPLYVCEPAGNEGVWVLAIKNHERWLLAGANRTSLKPISRIPPSAPSGITVIYSGGAIALMDGVNMLSYSWEAKPWTKEG